MPFGTPGVDTNFWFGLDNLNDLTYYKDSFTYNLQIDLCCGDNLVASLQYDNFVVRLKFSKNTSKRFI